MRGGKLSLGQTYGWTRSCIYVNIHLHIDVIMYRTYTCAYK
ncbi:hypothetical protein E2C01_037164 [Portunus trituberculatus]|uniref:Uncharacterized protein n=1 Tax=Portunus trituberculatus TaxID=210409 RepID=A0A5B7FDF1_PORTR|nr:hypothetical protein [Portunus trituberculatus]